MSTLRAANIANIGATKTSTTDGLIDGAAKAWVNFNGTGTVAIRKAFNVSSITDNGTGDYTVNFTTPMPDANYSGVVTAGSSTHGGTSAGCSGTGPHAAVPTTSAFRVLVFTSSTAAAFDSAQVNVTVFD